MSPPNALPLKMVPLKTADLKTANPVRVRKLMLLTNDPPNDGTSNALSSLEDVAFVGACKYSTS